jgi:tryptophan-rich sensory protein
VTGNLLQKFALWVLGIALLILLVLKCTQLYREPQTTGNLGLSVLRGLDRRLDDPSFWAIAACFLAGWFVRKATAVLSPSNALRRPAATADPVFPVVWATTAIAGIAIYTLSAYINHEAWFDKSHDHVIHLVQFIEGCVCAVVIAMSPLFFSLGLLCLSETRARLKIAEATKQKDEAARWASGYLASAGAGPFISGIAAWALLQVLGRLGPHIGISFKPDPFGTSEVISVIIAQVSFAAPFVALLLLVSFQLRRCVKLGWKDVKVANAFGFLLILTGFGAWHLADTCKPNGELKMAAFQLEPSPDSPTPSPETERMVD